MTSNTIEIKLPIQHKCSSNCAQSENFGMRPQPNPTYDPKTETCGDNGKEDDHRSPTLLSIEGDELWVPQGEFARPDELVIPDEEIIVHIEYPLTKPAKMKLKHKGGFSRKRLVHAIVDAYKYVYDKEAQTGPLPGVGPTFNRPRTHGKYGIWGHDINDLWLEGIMYNPTSKVMTRYWKLKFEIVCFIADFLLTVMQCKDLPIESYELIDCH